MNKRELDEMTFAELAQLIVDATEAIRRKAFESGYAQSQYDTRAVNLSKREFSR